MARPTPNQALKRERFRQQMSRTALAHRTGLSSKALNDIECGRVRPRLDSASRVADALGVQVTDIFDVDRIIG